MIGGVVEALAEGRHYSKSRGFLIAQENGTEVGRVPLDQIDALILAARSATISRSLANALTEQGSVVVFSGQNFEPESLLLPAQSGKFTIGHPEDQAAATLAFHGKLWRQLTRQKIAHQAAVLAQVGESSAASHLNAMISRVKTGDSGNIEAAAARAYFPALFGRKFTRDRDANGINAHLNYGYAILRAACARSICAVGLSPALGMHHRSRRNPLCLADDLIELFRPIVDHLVFVRLAQAKPLGELLPDDKRHLAQVLELPMVDGDKQRPVTSAIHHAALSIAQAYANRLPSLALPTMTFQTVLVS